MLPTPGLGLALGPCDPLRPCSQVCPFPAPIAGGMCDPSPGPLGPRDQLAQTWEPRLSELAGEGLSFPGLPPQVRWGWADSLPLGLGPWGWDLQKSPGLRLGRFLCWGRGESPGKGWLGKQRQGSFANDAGKASRDH